MGSNTPPKLDDPVATALGSDTDSLSLGSVAKSKQSAKRTAENQARIRENLQSQPSVTRTT